MAEGAAEQHKRMRVIRIAICAMCMATTPKDSQSMLCGMSGSPGHAYCATSEALTLLHLRPLARAQINPWRIKEIVPSRIGRRDDSP